ncbi:MAG: hypothetical protein KF734_01145 [Saprospiraceae bacterium]|nr:hypothetical protein [Saprospiraceae bacterium]
MKNKIFLFLLPLLTALWLFGCYKDAPPPYVKPDPCPWPEITTQGLNTFGCKINGKEWVPCVDLYGNWASLRPLECLVTESDGSNSLSISALRSVLDTTYSHIDSNGLISLGFRPCTEGTLIIPSGFQSARILMSVDWEATRFEVVDLSANNYLMVNRLDTEANIISGQFQMTLIDTLTGKKVEITDGRFDLKYYPQ